MVTHGEGGGDPLDGRFRPENARRQDVKCFGSVSTVVKGTHKVISSLQQTIAKWLAHYWPFRPRTETLDTGTSNVLATGGCPQIGRQPRRSRARVWTSVVSRKTVARRLVWPSAVQADARNVRHRDVKCFAGASGPYLQRRQALRPWSARRASVSPSALGGERPEHFHPEKHVERCADQCNGRARSKQQPAEWTTGPWPTPWVEVGRDRPQLCAMESSVLYVGDPRQEAAALQIRVMWKLANRACRR